MMRLYEGIPYPGFPDYMSTAAAAANASALLHSAATNVGDTNTGPNTHRNSYVTNYDISGPFTINK